MADVRLSSDFFSDVRFEAMSSIINEQTDVSDSFWETRYRMIMLWKYCLESKRDILKSTEIMAAMRFFNHMDSCDKEATWIITQLLRFDFLEEIEDEKFYFKVNELEKVGGAGA